MNDRSDRTSDVISGSICRNIRSLDGLSRQSPDHPQKMSSMRSFNYCSKMCLRLCFQDHCSKKFEPFRKHRENAVPKTINHLSMYTRMPYRVSKFRTVKSKDMAASRVRAFVSSTSLWCHLPGLASVLQERRCKTQACTSPAYPRTLRRPALVRHLFRLSLYCSRYRMWYSGVRAGPV